MMSVPASYDLVLIGGGHAHALALRKLAMQPIKKTRITLISPQAMTAYSGMLPGLLAGHYQFADTHIDLPQLCRWAGVRFVQQSVTALDTSINRLALDDGSSLDFDWLSINVGGTPSFDGVPGAEQFSVPVKPVSGFYQRWQTLMNSWSAAPTSALRKLVVVGSGAGGCELVLAMAHALARRHLNAELHLIGTQFLTGYSDGSRRKMRRALASYKIHLHSPLEVHRISADSVHTDQGQIKFDTLFWCTGVGAPNWLSQSQLRCTDDGFIEVDKNLRSVSHPHIFAAGDCAKQRNSNTPRAGVYAVRQAPTLTHNLKATIEGQLLKPFRPQRDFLSLLSLGGQHAIANRNGLAIAGDWVWRWKHAIDRRFMDKLNQLPVRPPVPSSDPHDPPRCAGCGAKVGDTALQSALTGLQPVEHDNILSGLRHREDASVVRWPANQTLVQSHDYFPAFIDDPYLFGRLAALHSLSDIYARGATPHSALATVSLSINHHRLQGRDLSRLMQGAVEELNRADCALLGGHTIEGAQMAAGFTINASAHDGRLFSKRGANHGDQLILTKALGAGVLLAALMQPLRCGEWYAALIAEMLRSNAPAMRLLQQPNVAAVTDVTGFGLLGHVLEMCDASGVALNLFADRIPALPGAMTLFQRGVASSLKPSNDAALARCDIATRWLDHPLLALLTDPQTCGGLIAAVPAEHLQDCLHNFAQAQLPVWHIGEFVAAEKVQVVIR